MKTFIKLYDDIVTKVKFFSKQLKLKFNKSTGRPLAIKGEEIIALSIFKQRHGIPTKKSIWKIFKENLNCSYKTLVVNMNRLSICALLILNSIFLRNQKHSHIAKHHRTLRRLASWGYSGKGFFYGLKMTITTDLKRQMLGVKFASGNSNDREIFKKLNKDMEGIFVADAGYISKELEKDFYIENRRVLFAKPRANMKRMATWWQLKLYETRMQIELNFRNLKMFHNLQTSLPRSIDGYFGNYVYSLLAFVLG